MNTVDIGDHCVECLQSTAMGSGKFVNRVPAGNEKYDGFMCAECQMIECDRCDELTLEYNTINGEWICDDCITDDELLELIKEDT